MPYTIQHDPVLNIGEVIFFGLIGGNDLREATSEAVSLQKRTGAKRFLIDANGWDMRASFVDIFKLVDKQYWEQELNRETCIAVILPTSLSGAQAAQFYETACQNRGWHAKVFLDRQGAIAWLTGANASSRSAVGHS